jgi:hypothetical protein
MGVKTMLIPTESRQNMNATLLLLARRFDSYIEASQTLPVFMGHRLCRRRKEQERPRKR